MAYQHRWVLIWRLENNTKNESIAWLDKVRSAKSESLCVLRFKVENNIANISLFFRYSREVFSMKASVYFKTNVLFLRKENIKALRARPRARICTQDTKFIQVVFILLWLDRITKIFISIYHCLVDRVCRLSTAMKLR